MKSIARAFLSLLAALILASVASAAQLGDVAAPLKISTWTKGKAVDLAAVKGKQIVVVEFWATWCPPCRASIPHLTELQKKFKDVVFIGVSNEDPDTVKKFVAKMGDQMDYIVAVDQDDQTGDGYLKAFGINGIPHAFIVDKTGKIVWQGHPMDGLGEVLADIVAGKYDVETAKKRSAAREQAREKLEQFVKLAMTDDTDPKLEKLGVEIVAIDKEIGGIEAGQKFDPAEILRMVRFRKALDAYKKLAGNGQLASADGKKLEEQLAANAPKGFKMTELKEQIAVHGTFMEYYRAVAMGAEQEKVAALAKKVAEVKTRDANTLNMMAWIILTDEKIQQRDFALAAKLARMAVDVSDAKDPESLDTYAHALFDAGKTDEAITWQKKAVAVAANDDMRKELEATLKNYQAKAAK